MTKILDWLFRIAMGWYYIAGIVVIVLKDLELIQWTWPQAFGPLIRFLIIMAFYVGIKVWIRH